MAQMTRRSAGSDSGGSPPSDSSSQTELSIAGVSDSRGPPAARSELLRGSFISSADIPEVVSPGQDVTITGRVKLSDVGAGLVEKETRVRLSSPSLRDDKVQPVGKLGNNDTAPFSFSFTVPGSPGDTLPVTITPEVRPPSLPGTGGFNEGELKGPVAVDVVSNSEKQAKEASGYVVQAALGAGAGAVVSAVTGRSPIPLAIAGGGVAGLAKFSGINLSPGSLLSGVVPNIPTTQIAVLGGAALAGSLLLRSSGASEVLQPAGEAAGSAVSAGGSAVDRARREIERRR